MNKDLKNAPWQPNATIAHLQQRSRLIQNIRTFFLTRNVWEVETPLLAQGVATDPHLQAFSCQVLLPEEKSEKLFYLQTSPEFAMKRLLAANSGAIFQITKAFRKEACSPLHNPEFTILEWYRPGFNHHDLMDEMDALLQFLLKMNPAQRYSYQSIFLKYTDCDPLNTSIDTLKKLAIHLKLPIDHLQQATLDQWLENIMNLWIEPQLKGIVFIYDYPPSQALLSKIRNDDPPVAERFEVYIHGIELANGYHELLDANEQHQRMQQDNLSRQALGLTPLPIDENFIAALRAGMPACAGVALGIDRLMQIALGQNKIEDVMSFNIVRA